MHHFHNILLVSHGLGDEEDALKQALKLTCTNHASLTVLITCPEFPKTIAGYEGYEEIYEQSLIKRMEKAIDAVKSTLKISKKKLSIHIELDSGSAPDVRIIRYVMRNSIDLLIKQAEMSQKQQGFKAVDMELLRKCPCPLFIVRPTNHTDKDIRIGVAIDAKNEEPVGRELSLQLLTIASSLSSYFAVPLHIISCWCFRLEHYLRENILITVPEDELDRMVLNEKKEHGKALQALIDHSRIKKPYQLHLQKGLPEETIATFIENNRIDVLVMGTVARTGISSFIIGNTAENILQKIDCSLLALKPQGFVSPVKAY